MLRVNSVTRRRVVVAGAAAGLVAAPFVRGAYAAGKLNVGFWDHWVPGANDVMSAVVKEWSEKEKVEVQLDFITTQANKLLLTTAAEAQAQTGHDILAFTSFLPARYSEQMVPVNELMDELIKQNGKVNDTVEYLGKVDLKSERGPVVVTVFDQDRIADYQTMVAKLRHAGIRAELYLGSGKFGPQMKYADRRNSPCVVIQGSDEKARGEVTIKDLIVGAELAKLEKGREQHLQKQAEAQRSVPEKKMVEAVREVLARHRVL